jgi:hypothetical protein
MEKSLQKDLGKSLRISPAAADSMLAAGISYNGTTLKLKGICP